MSRISIDVSPEEHKRLKALAALQGKSIKEFVLESTLGRERSTPAESSALVELEALLARRLANASGGGLGSRTVVDIVEQVKREAPGLEPND